MTSSFYLFRTLVLTLILSTLSIFYLNAQNKDSSPKCNDEELQKLLEYPESARLEAKEGSVTLKILVNKQGKVTKVKVISSTSEVFEEPAINAIKKVKWTAGKINENPKDIWVQRTIKFDLNEEKDIKGSIDKTATTDMNVLTKYVKYPEAAKKQGKEGKVILRLLISKTGEVKRTEIASSTDEVFNKAAVNAAKKAKWEPGINKGKPVASWVTIPIKFKLN